MENGNVAEFENLEIPDDQPIGGVGKRSRYPIHSLNAESTLIAAECIGAARWLID